MGNWTHTAGKAIQILREKGMGEVLWRIRCRFGRKRGERRILAQVRIPERKLEKQRKAVFSPRIRFSIAVPLYNTPAELLREMIDSVCAQSYGDWELCLADGSDEAHGEVGAYCLQRAAAEPRIRYRKLEKNGGISGNSNAALEMAQGEYIALLDHDDMLTPNALYEMRSAIEKTGADFLYSDEMVFRSPDPNRVSVVRLKPGYAPDTLLTNNYICHLTVFSRELMEKAGKFRKEYDGSQDHDLFLRLTNRAKGIAHVSKVLYLWRSVPGSTAEDINSKQYAIDAGRRAVRDFLRAERGTDAEVESTEVFPTMYRVRYPIEGNPRVRVIMDARGETGGTAEKLRALRETAGWDNCAWILMGGEETEGAERIEPREGEHRSSLWQRAAEGDEEYLMWFNGMPEPLDQGWLREMLGHAQQPHVGAVGAKILLREGNIAHAGVILGMGSAGIAGRPYYLAKPATEGYFGQIAVTQNLSAVTDCLLVSRRKMEEAGGFCAEYGDALFEVDLCLRLGEKGYYQVFVPHARMRMRSEKEVYFDVGREYATYGEDAKVFRRRNAAQLRQGDPYYHPMLSLKYEDWRYR